MNTRPTLFLALFFGLLSLPGVTHAAGPPGDWNSVPVFAQSPLEARLGVFRVQPNPDALAVVLWNDGNNNRLDAVQIPPPYDGSGISSTPLENTATLFALGDICTTPDAVIVPYIKDFNVEVARFDGNSWQTSTLPGTTTNNFDSTDCVNTNAGVIIAGHDLTDSETELFRSIDQGQSYTFYGRYGNVAGPFDGAVREPLSTPLGGRYIVGSNLTTTGSLRITRIDTLQTPPAISHTPVRVFSPPAGFSFVREAAARCLGDSCYITYNQDGFARSIDITVETPSQHTERVLGAVNNSGSQFTFQGASVLPISETDSFDASEVIAAWDELFSSDPFKVTPPDIDTSYPLRGVGGPSDTCLRETSDGKQHVVVLGPRVGAAGTDLHTKTLLPPPIFADGFESGDVSSWSGCD